METSTARSFTERTSTAPASTLPILTWSDNFRVGVRVLDDDHLGLFEAINSLQGAIVTN
jgi:hypothetical protein